MTRVLVAAASADEGVRVASASRRLFGDDAEYTVLNVATNAARGMAWGDGELTWGPTAPWIVAPVGGAVGAPPLAIRRDLDDGEAHAAGRADTAVDLAHEVAADVVTAADLPNARPLGDVGDPTEAILATVRHVQSDVVVVGSHDRSWLSRLVNPSVTRAVVDDAGIPVLVVPPAITDADPSPDGG